MTIVDAVTTPAPGTLSRAFRGVGYGRVSFGAVASGTLDGTVRHVVVGLERVVVAEVRVRLGGSRVNVVVNGPTAFTHAIESVVLDAFTRTDTGAGEVVVTLRMPMRNQGGADIAEAACVATLDALVKALELALTDAARADVVAHAVGGGTVGLASPGIGLSGLALHPTARLLLVLAQQEKGLDVATVSKTKTDVTFYPFADDASEAEVAAWLCATTEGADHPVRTILEAVSLGMSGVYGVLGGTHPDGAIAVVCASDALTTTQQLGVKLAGVLPSGWKTSVTKTAKPLAH